MKQLHGLALSVARNRFLRTNMLFIICAFPAILNAQDLDSLPISLSEDRADILASLPPPPQTAPTQLSSEARQWRASLIEFNAQNLWPIRVEYEDGSQYWGEVTRINMTAFELWNRKTNQTITLGYAGMCQVEKVKDYGVGSKYSLYRASLPERVPEQARPLTPEELIYKRAAEHFALFDRRFVRCELKDHSVVTGAIVAVGPQDFTVRPGKLHDDRVILYRELSAPPRPTAAVGAYQERSRNDGTGRVLCGSLTCMHGSHW